MNRWLENRQLGRIKHVNIFFLAMSIKEGLSVGLLQFCCAIICIYPFANFRSRFEPQERGLLHLKCQWMRVVVLVYLCEPKWLW